MKKYGISLSTVICCLIIFFVYLYVESKIMIILYDFFVIGVCAMFLFFECDNSCPYCGRYNSIKKCMKLSDNGTTNHYSTEVQRRETGSIYRGASKVGSIYRNETVQHLDVVHHSTWLYKCKFCDREFEREHQDKERKY